MRQTINRRFENSYNLHMLRYQLLNEEMISVAYFAFADKCSGIHSKNAFKSTKKFRV